MRRLVQLIKYQRAAHAAVEGRLADLEELRREAISDLEGARADLRTTRVQLAAKSQDPHGRAK